MRLAQGAARWLAALLAAIGLTAVPTPAGAGAEPLTPTEVQGRQIYLKGSSPTGGEVTALLGDASVEVPAAALPCGSCHGRDGRGRPEGGVDPSDLTWSRLTRPYEVATPSGRSRPPYTEHTLIRAIALGVDPAGDELDRAMPRYRLSPEDAAALVAYMKRLGAEPEPGVSEEALRLGALLPPERPGGAGEAVAATLRAYFAEVNAAGGLWGRRLELEGVAAGASAPETRRRLEELLAEQPVLALVAPVLGGARDEILELAAERELPLIGALAADPPGTLPPPRYGFFLLSGPREQVRALVVHAAGAESPRPWTVLTPESEDAAGGALLDALAREAEARRVEEVGVVTYAGGAHDAPALVRWLREQGTGTLLLLGAFLETVRILGELESAGWHPPVYVLAAHAAAALLDGAGRGLTYSGELYLAVPFLEPPDAAADARFRRLAEAHGLPAEHALARRAAFAAAALTEEVLRRSGRRVTRERVVEELEGLSRLPTGALPPLSFGPNRRIGAYGAHVVGRDPVTGALRPIAWIELD